MLEKDCNLKIGKIGTIYFKSGIYAYVGSGMKNLFGRVRRHINKKKKYHWHIDYFLDIANIIGIITIESEEKIECQIASFFSHRFNVIEKFGSSDCRCKGHLFFLGKRGLLKYA